MDRFSAAQRVGAVRGGRRARSRFPASRASFSCSATDSTAGELSAVHRALGVQSGRPTRQETACIGQNRMKGVVAALWVKKKDPLIDSGERPGVLSTSRWTRTSCSVAPSPIGANGHSASRARPEVNRGAAVLMKFDPVGDEVGMTTRVGHVRDPVAHPIGASRNRSTSPAADSFNAANAVFFVRDDRRGMRETA